MHHNLNLNTRKNVEHRDAHSDLSLERYPTPTKDSLWTVMGRCQKKNI